MAMAENPAFFTVAPWGYRLLPPTLVHLLWRHHLVRGFRRTALASLTVAALILFLFLRRLGHGELAALVGVLLFALSPPVREALRHPFLAEPVAIALFVAFLWLVEAGAGTGLLALVAALGILAKEIGFLALPLVFLTSRTRTGSARSVVRTGLVALPAVSLAILLRMLWGTGGGAAPGGPDLARLHQGVVSILASAREWGGAVLLLGVTPLAVVGAVRASGRRYLARYGYLAVATLVLPFAAGLYSGAGVLGSFFAADVPRLLLYALPVLLPLALAAATPPLRPGEPLPSWRPHRTVEAVAILTTVGLAAALGLGLDGYRRVALGGARDGPLVLGLCRESLRTARRLARGEAVSFDPEHQRFAWGESDPGALGRMRWFLRDGWGPLPHYGTDDIVMRGPRATLLLPSLEPEDLDLGLALDAPATARVRVFVNGHGIGTIVASPRSPERWIRVPGSALVRGDNEVVLVRPGTGSGVIRLTRLAYRPRAR